jgi:hypothetical protein
VYKIIGEQFREDADGVPQTACIGVINPLNPRVENPEQRWPRNWSSRPAGVLTTRNGPRTGRTCA